MRTNINIDDKLMNEAMTLSQLKTKKAVVETGLKLLATIFHKRLLFCVLYKSG